MASFLELMVWGLQDALAPLPLVVLAFFLAFCLVVSSEKKVLFRSAVLFLLVFFLLSLVTEVGFLSFLLLLPLFFEIARWFFIFLAGGMVLIGARFFLAWMRLKSDASGQCRQISALLSFQVRWAKGPVIIIAAITTSLALMIWPPNAFITLIVNDSLLPGKLVGSVGTLAVYEFFKIIPMLLVVPAVLLLTGQVKAGDREILSQSMVLILLSAFYLGIGLSVVYFSINQLN